MNKAEVIKLAKEKAPLIFSLAAGFGLTTTTILSAKAGAKISDKAKKQQYEFMEGKDKASFIFKEGVKTFIPTAISFTATAGFIAASYIFGEKNVEQLTAVLAGTDLMLRAHEQAEKNGISAKEYIADSILEKEDPFQIYDTETGDTVYFEPYSHQFFRASREFVIECQYHFNRNFQLRGYGTLSEFLEFLGLHTSNYTDSIGWSDISEGVYGYRWIDFTETKRTSKEGLDYISIDYPFPPHYDYLDPYEGQVTGAKQVSKWS